VRGAAEVELGRTVLAHTHRFIHAMLSVEAVRRRLREAGGLPELAEFLDAAAEVLDATQRALLCGQQPGTVPDLRPLQDRLATMLVEDPARAGGVDTATTLVDATDRITNSLDTLISELRRQLPLASAR
jgi:DNA-binding response OmpR family regulator